MEGYIKANVIGILTRISNWSLSKKCLITEVPGNGNCYRRITIMKNVEFLDGILKIEIENVTYPHSGFLLLNLNNNKIKVQYE